MEICFQSCLKTELFKTVDCVEYPQFENSWQLKYFSRVTLFSPKIQAGFKKSVKKIIYLFDYNVNFDA